MAVLSDYTDGTITVTGGSVDFTGTNTLWRSAAFREGDTVLLQGFTGVIAGTSEDDPLILSNTTGQFTEPWPGASGTFSYRMRYQPDNARFSAKSTALINLLANGILRGIADIGVEEGKLLIGGAAGLYDLIDKSELGLQDPNGSLGKLAALTLAANKVLNTDTSGNLTQSDITAEALVLFNLAGTATANKLPYLDTPNSAALTDLTAFARTILDDSNGAAMWNTMGAAQNIAANGYTKLPNGLIIQWGRSYAADGDRAITLPMAFPNFVLLKHAIVELAYTPTSTRVATVDGVATLNSITVRFRSVTNGGAVAVPSDGTIGWFAIGY